MQNKSHRVIKKSSRPFSTLVDLAQKGDQEALAEIIQLFEEEIEYLSNFIRQPREDSIQELTVELISIILGLKFDPKRKSNEE
jgi:hypothetical protein